MNILQSILHTISYALRWWFVVLPWEQGIRVRLGKHVRCFGNGLHFMIPFVDHVYVQNTRMRISPVPAQTVSTSDGRSVTICGSLTYRISDVLKLHQTLHQAESTLDQRTVGLVAEYVVSHPLADCTPTMIAAAVNARLKLEEFGLADSRYTVTDFAVVRTYRLISDAMGHGRWVPNPLDTTIEIGHQHGAK